MLLRGASGSGKSSLLQGISWALGASTVPSTHLRRNGAGKLQVDVFLDIDGQLLQIRRGEESELVGRDKVVRGAKASQDWLRGLIGIPDLQALTYRAQKSRGTFLSLSDEAKKAFLVQAVPDLGLYEQAAERAAAQATTAENATIAAKAAMQLAEQVRREMPDLGPPPVQPVPDVERRAQHEKVLADTADYLRDMDASIAAAEAAPPPRDDEADAIRDQIRMCEDELRRLAGEERDYLAKLAADRQAHAVEHHRLMSAMAGARADRARGDALVQQGRSAVQDCRHWLEQPEPECRECHQPLPAPQKADAERRLADAERGLDQMERDLENLIRAEENADVAHSQHPRWSEPEGSIFQDDVDAVTAALRERQRLLADRVSPALHQRMVGIAQLRRERDQAAAHRDEVLLSLKSDQIQERAAQLDYERALRSWERDLASLKAANERVLAASEMYSRATVAEQEAEDLATAMGRQGFLGAIFDEILSTVSGAVSDTLAASPNTADLTFRFVSEVESKSGRSQRRIAAQLRRGTLDLDPRDGPSGGQGSVLDLAVDLAMGEELRRRSGIDPAWMFLDEPFEGCGPRDVEAMLEMLRKYAEHRLIIVVDHATETREWFDQVWAIQEGVDGATLALL